MTPWLEDADVRLYHGDVLQVLREFPAESVDCVVTSPPYWGLRDYGTGAWEGGEADCQHQPRPSGGPSQLQGASQRGRSDVGACKCGATRIDQQLGLEPTPEQYVERMVEVFREVRRVLAAHGTVWLNLGDSYATDGPGAAYGWTNGKTSEHDAATIAAYSHKRTSLAAKNLVGIPWRVAFALQADGWYLRSDIIWAKPNPMPESVTDRPTKAHEYVFLLSKQPRYFFDQEAVREPLLASTLERGYTAASVANGPGPKAQANPDVNWNGGSWTPPAGRNIRSVWEIATQPYPEAHFATFPEELARRCIAAGCPEQVCRMCGKARERVVERESFQSTSRTNPTPEYGRSQRPIRGPSDLVPRPIDDVKVTTLGFTDCGHSDYRPGIVLDPFVGSGTTMYVARKLGRHAVGIDLNESYLELAARRLQQQSLFAEPAA